MNKLPVRVLALVVTMGAVATAGCGGSSNPKSKLPTSPSTPSTPTTAISASTPITSAAYRAILIEGERRATQGKFTQAQLASLAGCAISKLSAQGVRTVGQALQHQSEFSSLGAQCAKQLGLTAK